MPLSEYKIDSKKLKKQYHIKGEIFTDQFHKAIYMNSASLLEIYPSAIIYPYDKDDVASIVNYCRENKIPITCRGGGSGTSGQSLGRGIILDFSVYMNKIIRFNPGEKSVTVQPGLVCDKLNDFLKKQGYFFPPDPSSSAWATIGGMAMNNSGGSHSLKYGTARNYVKKAELIFNDGSIFQASKIRINEIDNIKSSTARQKIKDLTSLIKANYKKIIQNQPEAVRSSSGYNLFDIITSNTENKRPTPSEIIKRKWKSDISNSKINFPNNGYIDIPALISGSEGTLAIATEFQLDILPVPKSQSGLVIQLKDIDSMPDAVLTLLEYNPSMIELLDYSFIEIVRSFNPNSCLAVKPETSCILLVEFDGDIKEEVTYRTISAYQRVLENSYHSKVDTAYDLADMDEYKQIRKAASPLMSRQKSDNRPTRWIEDCSVPPWNLSEFIKGMYQIFTKYQLKGYFFGHAGEGILHTNPVLNLTIPDDRKRLVDVAQDVALLVKSLGGVMSGEHGDGLQRTPLVNYFFKELYPIFKQVKDIFDPDYLFNPDVKVEKTNRSIDSDIRSIFNPDNIISADKLYSHYLTEEVIRCHGCGLCLNFCPALDVEYREEFSPRARMNILRAILTNKVSVKNYQDTEFIKLMNNCLFCKSCLVKCPSQIDAARSAVISKNWYIVKNSLSKRKEFLTDTRSLSKIGSNFPIVTEKCLSSRFIRNSMERIFGLDRNRVLPSFSKTVLDNSKYKIDGQSKSAILFADCNSLYYNTESELIPSAELINQSGYNLEVVDDVCCGIANISSGMLGKGLKKLIATIERLYPFAQKELPIIFTGISCYSAVKEEAIHFLNSEKANLVSRYAIDIHQFLIEENIIHKIKLDSTKKVIAYHHPCHYKSSIHTNFPVFMLNHIPGAKVIELNAKCCGMAGTFGLNHENFENSLKIGRELKNQIEELSQETIISTPCGTCAQQIFQLTGRKAYHPVGILYDCVK